MGHYQAVRILNSPISLNQGSYMTRGLPKNRLHYVTLSAARFLQGAVSWRPKLTHLPRSTDFIHIDLYRQPKYKFTILICYDFLYRKCRFLDIDIFRHSITTQTYTDVSMYTSSSLQHSSISIIRYLYFSMSIQILHID